MRYTFIRFPENRKKAVTFSYDDGVKADLRLAEVADKHGIKVTFNICSGNIGINDWNLTEDEIKTNILAKGHEIAVHGKYHKAEGKQRPVEGIKDVLDCRCELEEKFGVIVRGMAYPDSGIGTFENGANYENIKGYLSDLDITYARTTGNDKRFALPTDWYNWTPTAHHNNPEIFDYINKFCTEEKTYVANNTARLFYMWGHSYEFDRDGNWDRLDEICEKIGGKSDIWYATNGEIYTYVNAYNTLVRSADGRIVYNPTVMKVWFCCDGVEYSVNPNEKVVIDG